MNPQKNRKRKSDKGRSVHSNKAVVLLALFCLCIGGISLVSAKYIQQTATKNNSATAKEFYFESDLLDGREHVVVPTIQQDGTTTASVTFRVKNHVDELRYSEVDISYTVTVTDREGQPASEVRIDKPTGPISAGKAADGKTNDVDVTLSNLQAGKTYTVTATTDDSYQKTLTGTITVTQPDNEIYASVSDKTQYIEVTVWTTDYAGEVKLTYGNIGLIPDNTDAKMADALSTGSTITESNWGANTSHVFRFFKSDTIKKYQVNVDNASKEVTVSAAA